MSQWRDSRCSSQVTAIAQSQANKDVFAVGYEDGSIRLWDLKTAALVITFNGHRSSVTTLAFDRGGVRLASGSKDTNIIVWDIIAEEGLYKLRGHKDEVTGIKFVEPQPELEVGDGNQQVMTMEPSIDGWLLTTSKDSLIKLWDLSVRYCVETHVTQTNEECWALGISPDHKTCITAGNGGELKVWGLNTSSLLDSRSKVNVPASVKYLEVQGTFLRRNIEKVIEIIFHPKHDYFAVHGKEKSVEIWRMRSEAEIKKSLARKLKRRREKAREEGNDKMHDHVCDLSNADLTDIYVSHSLLRTGGKVRSIDWTGDHPHLGTKKAMQLLVGTTNNQLELYRLEFKEKNSKKDEKAECTLSLSVELPGHRSDIRAVALSSDSKMLATASNGTVKVWNVKTQKCIRTFDECGHVICCAFLPGDKIVITGTKSGELELLDVVSATLLEKIKAHDGAIYGLQVHPDSRYLVSGSADSTAKFWEFKIVHEAVLDTTRTSPRLQLVLKSKVIKVSDEILAIRFSPDAKYLAVALLDFTVKVFFVDSLKLYLNLYGHKLPVTSLDISSDSKLIVTCSADKTIRMWGLDFGDCHRILRNHTDSILQVAFVPGNKDWSGHRFFSASKDRTIRYWDGDKFQQIQRLDGHHGEIWAMAIAQDASFIVTAAHDKSIRVWHETDEQIFLEEERERELEELYESTLTKSLEKDEEHGQDDEGNAVGAVTKQTIETLTAGERIQDALERGMKDLNILAEWEEQRKLSPCIAPPQRDVVFMAQGNISAEEYVMHVLENVHSEALKDALRVLRFSDLPAVFTFVRIFAKRNMNILLAEEVMIFLLKIHYTQIISTPSMRPELESIRDTVRPRLLELKDMVNFNVAALRVINRRIEQKRVKHFVDGDQETEEGEQGPSKGRSANKRAFVQIS